MKPKFKYAKREDIPAGYEALYTEVNGEWVMTEVEGLASHADVSRLTEALRKERNDHKTTRDSAAALTSALDAAGVTAEDLPAALTELETLKAGGGKAGDVAKLRVELSSAQRTIDTLTKENNERQTKIDKYAADETTRTVHGALEKAAIAADIKDPNVLADIKMYAGMFSFDDATQSVLTREGYMSPEVWLTSMKDTRSHWFPQSQGGGSMGGKGGNAGGVNPFSAAGWNLTEQAKVISADRGRAEQLAKLAGTSIGGARPEK